MNQTFHCSSYWTIGLTTRENFTARQIPPGVGLNWGTQSPALASALLTIEVPDDQTPAPVG
ncbi:MAG: hypothetical protein RIM23_26360 [Coleofasciculus sp. G3-WIS-01]